MGIFSPFNLSFIKQTCAIPSANERDRKKHLILILYTTLFRHLRIEDIMVDQRRQLLNAEGPHTSFCRSLTSIDPNLCRHLTWSVVTTKTTYDYSTDEGTTIGQTNDERDSRQLTRQNDIAQTNLYKNTSRSGVLWLRHT